MFGYHDRNVVHTCRSFCQPSVGIVHSQLRVYPSFAPFRCYQVPELVQIPECVPESITSQCCIVFVRQTVYFFISRNPFSVYVTPYVSTTQCAIHIIIETYLFHTVGTCNLYSVEQFVPYLFLILLYSFKVPSKRTSNFFFKIE